MVKNLSSQFAKKKKSDFIIVTSIFCTMLFTYLIQVSEEVSSLVRC